LGNPNVPFNNNDIEGGWGFRKIKFEQKISGIFQILT